MRIQKFELTHEIAYVQATLPSGWGWNTAVVKLPRGGTLLYSPSWFGPETFEFIEHFGEPRVLVAPNHFHHLALPRYRARYPKAKAVCSKEAAARLKRKKHHDLAHLDEVVGCLPEGAAFHVLPGTRTGEAWLSVPTERGCVLLVGDAVFYLPGPLSGIEGAGLRVLQVAPGVKVSRTFQFLAIRQANVYGQAMEQCVQQLQPARVLPSHGEPLVTNEQMTEWLFQNRRRLKYKASQSS